MPYGKRTTIKNTRASAYATRGRNARQNKVAVARTAVAKIQRKPYVPRVVKNTQSVYQLASQRREETTIVPPRDVSETSGASPLVRRH